MAFVRLKATCDAADTLSQRRHKIQISKNKNLCYCQTHVSIALLGSYADGTGTNFQEAMYT
jgi:hypothetical protein